MRQVDGGVPRLTFGRWLVPAAQIVVAGALMWWLLGRGGVFRELLEALRGADPGWVVAGVVCAGVGVVANVWRWSLFLGVQGIRVGALRLVAIFLVGMFFNLFLLGVVGGELVMALFLMREHPGRRGAVLLSILADHLSGFLALAGAALGFTLLLGEWMTEGVLGRMAVAYLWGFLVFGAAGVGLSFLLSAEGVRERVPRWVPGRAKIVELAACYGLFGKAWGRFVAASGISVVVLGFYYGSYFCAAQAVGVGVGFADMLTLMPVVDVVAMVPVSVSGLGLREALFVDLLGSKAGTGAGAATLVSLTGFAFTVFWGLVGGVIFGLFKRGRRKDG